MERYPRHRKGTVEWPENLVCTLFHCCCFHKAVEGDEQLQLEEEEEEAEEEEAIRWQSV